MNLEKIQNYVKESFKNKSYKHFERTAYWVKQIDPKADDSLLIAAYMHDIERAFRKPVIDDLAKRIGYDNPEFLRIHQEGGALIAKDFLVKEGFDKDLAEKVSKLVAHHEVGGDRDSDVLMEADSISFLETNVAVFIERVKNGVITKDKALDKVNFMFNRIKSDRSKKLCKSIYMEKKSILEKM